MDTDDQPTSISYPGPGAARFYQPTKARRRGHSRETNPTLGLSLHEPEVTNPVPDLLTDSTLRRGDIVMFPEGPRVFNGQGSKHALTDFVPVLSQRLHGRERTC
jgi:hypothetical protein